MLLKVDEAERALFPKEGGRESPKMASRRETDDSEERERDADCGRDLEMLVDEDEYRREEHQRSGTHEGPGRSDRDAEGGSNPMVDPMTLPRDFGSTIYVRGIEQETTELELMEIFSSAGKIYEVRIPKDNRGYAFIVFEYASAVEEVLGAGAPKYYLRGSSKPLSVQLSNVKNRLFVGNLPRREPAHVMSTFFGNVSVGVEHVDCPVSDDGAGNKGFAFLEFYNHAAAEQAKKKIISPDFVLTGDNGKYKHKLTVSFAQPRANGTSGASGARPSFTREELRYNQGNGDGGDIHNSRTVYVRYLTEKATEEDLRRLFSAYGAIESVYIAPPRHGKARDFGFVHFVERYAAEAATRDSNRLNMDGRTLAIQIANNAIAMNGQPPERRPAGYGHGDADRPRGVGVIGENPRRGDSLQGRGGGSPPKPLLHAREVIMPDGSIGYVLVDPSLPPANGNGHNAYGDIHQRVMHDSRDYRSSRDGRQHSRRDRPY